MLSSRSCPEVDRRSLFLPAGTMTMDDKIAVNSVLLASGATISEMNTIRKQLSPIKGGRLAQAALPGKSGDARNFRCSAMIPQRLLLDQLWLETGRARLEATRRYNIAQLLSYRYGSPVYQDTRLSTVEPKVANGGVHDFGSFAMIRAMVSGSHWESSRNFRTPPSQDRTSARNSSLACQFGRHP